MISELRDRELVDLREIEELPGEEDVIVLLIAKRVLWKRWFNACHDFPLAFLCHIELAASRSKTRRHEAPETSQAVDCTAYAKILAGGVMAERKVALEPSI